MIAADLVAEAAGPAMNHDAHLAFGQAEGRGGCGVVHLPDGLDLEEVITGPEAADLPRAPVKGAVTDLAWLGTADGAGVLAPEQVTLVAVALADRVPGPAGQDLIELGVPGQLPDCAAPGPARDGGG
jgi:hypothetical protein